MRIAGELRRRLQMLLHRSQFQRDVEEEMRLHVELRQEQKPNDHEITNAPVVLIGAGQPVEEIPFLMFSQCSRR